MIHRLITLFLFATLSADPPESTLKKIGDAIWQNEGGKKVEFLIFWNEKEEFPSLGIAHFIWHPKNSSSPFEQTFPAFIAFAKAQGAPPPAWVEEQIGAPWRTREEFLQDSASPRVALLRSWLQDTVAIQTLFTLRRLDASLLAITNTLQGPEKKHVASLYSALQQTPAGLFALIDYLNFKGDGLKKEERYEGHGWGLKQVLLQTKEPTLTAFQQSASDVLKKRVESAPKERHEERFLKGWLARINRYSTF